ncbi:MAG: PA2778 family cysteine peptidase [Xanthomonadales bacterium]
MIRPAVVAVCAVLLTACAINPDVAIDELVDGRDEVALTVPFFPQTDYQCGPAALASILDDSGLSVQPDELAGMVYLPARRGSLQRELLAATRRHGRIAYEPPPRLENLLALLAAGKPVLVLQNLGVPSAPIWHYSVLVGFHTPSNRVLLNDGENRSKRVPAERFLRTWQWADRWAMIALQPGELPPHIDPERYFTAVSDLEQTHGTGAAEPAWRAANRAWPHLPQPYLALGNLAYGTGDRRAAVKHYRAGLRMSGGDVALTNNLAHVLGELQCAKAGLIAARPVLDELGPESPWRSIVAETVQTLEQQHEPDHPSCEQLIP